MVITFGWRGRWPRGKVDLAERIRRQPIFWTRLIAAGWDVSKKLEWLKEQAEWVFDVWLRLRPPRIQRYAGLVTLAGLGLLLMSFNDLLFELVLERLGFNREGSLAPVIGVVLIVINLMY